MWWNLARVVLRRWKRYGRAAVVIGEPMALGPWLRQQHLETGDLFLVDRSERLARVQILADSVLSEIAQLIPVTPVTLACAAIQSFEGDFIPHSRLIERMREMRDVLRELNARVVHREGTVEEIFDRAWRMLSMRRILVRSGRGYSLLPAGKPLVRFYANTIDDLLGAFARGVKERDRLPAITAEL
jgi:glycerol-3-phosphate O-acyltransferase